MAAPLPSDLTTVQIVKEYLPISTTTTDDDEIQRLISEVSLYVYAVTGRDVPSLSQVTQFTEIQSGTGSYRIFTKNWPIVQLISVQVDGVSLPISTGYNQPGVAIDQLYQNSIVIVPPLIGSFQTNVPGSIPKNFRQGINNVQIVYTAGFNGTPPDLQQAVTKIVAQEYQRRQTIDRESEAINAAGGSATIRYQSWWAAPWAQRVISRYARIAGVVR